MIHCQNILFKNKSLPNHFLNILESHVFTKLLDPVQTTIYTEHLIFGNKISINILQVCQISHKFMN